jgi:hypothetical protein
MGNLKTKTNNQSNIHQTFQSPNKTPIKSAQQNTSPKIKTGFDPVPAHIPSLFPVEIPFSSVDKLDGILD